MRYRPFFLLFFLFTVALTGCFRITQSIPDEGLWYCKELQITTDFDSGHCFAIIDNTQMDCAFCNDHGSNYVVIICQDPESKEYYLGEPIFEGTCIYYSEKTMVISEDQTEIVYTFYRQTSESAPTS